MYTVNTAPLSVSSQPASSILGQAVLIVGLSKGGAASFNGTMGTVEGWNEKELRYVVRSEVDGSHKLLKPENIEFLTGA